MGIRTALRQGKAVTFAVLLVGIWTVLVWLDVYVSIEWASADFVGQSFVSGVVGLIVLAVLFGLLVVLYGELGETDPAPDPWPPR